MFKGILYGLIGQALTFLQFQGGIKWGWTKSHPWLLMLGGIPISFFFMQSVYHLVNAFGGELWPSRLIGFGIGIIVFAIMSYFAFNEPITAKTAICISLALVIIAIQILWK